MLLSFKNIDMMSDFPCILTTETWCLLLFQIKRMMMDDKRNPISCIVIIMYQHSLAKVGKIPSKWMLSNNQMYCTLVIIIIIEFIHTTEERDVALW